MYFKLVEVIETKLEKAKDVSVAEATKSLFQ